MNNFEKSIYDYIQNYTGTSSIELSNTFGSGDFWLTSGNNVVVGFGLSDELSQALFNLTSRWEVIHFPCSQVIYLLDGCNMYLPIAQNIPKNGYKEPHWQPSLFYTYDGAVNYIEKLYKNNHKEKQFLLDLMKTNKNAAGPIPEEEFDYSL